MWDSGMKSLSESPVLDAVRCGNITAHRPEDSALPWPQGMAWDVLKSYLERDTCSVHGLDPSGGGAALD